MINKRNFLLATFGAAFLLTSVGAMAVPAKRGTRLYRQPDGSMVSVVLNGDEHFHYYLTSDSLPLVEDTDGSLYFASMSNGKLSKTPYLACDAGRRTEEMKKAVAGVDCRQVVSELRSRAMKTGRFRGVAQQGLGRFETTFPSKGKLKALVILVQYKDVKFTTDNAQQYFTDMLNKDGFSEYGGTGSAHQYFLDASNGQFDLTCDVYGPVTLPNNRAYYGGNDYSGSDKQPEDMVVDAVNLLKDKVDFSQYDCDKDGVLDNVFLFYAGTGEASGGPAESVWPHAWDLTSAGKAFTVSGVKVDHYACTCEMQGSKPDGIGTFCHEFSHIMGLPDLYNTLTSSVAYTPGEWSVMDYGPYNNDSRTPPTYSAYERNAMGWLDIEPVTEATSIKLDDIKSSNHAVMIATSRPKEFYLFENRQQTSWDTYLPNHGMLIWHVDYDPDVWDNNTVNNDRDHQYVDLVEANGAGNSAKGASWPGTLGKTEFTASTDPAFVDWKGKDAGLPITGIEEIDGKVYFDVAGGDFELDAPSGIEASELTPISMRLAWQPVDKAKGYVVSVYSENGLVQEYVNGFKHARVEAPTTSVVVKELCAETEYKVEVCAVSGSRMSQVATVAVTTPVMTFDYTTPEVLPAQNVGHDAFTACWKPVDGAVDYLLTVEGSYEVPPTTDNCNFDSLIFRIPNGWTYSLKTSRYTDPNWCGKAVPSAKMDKDGAYVKTAVYDHDILACSLWAKLSDNNSEAEIKVDGLVNDKWVPVSTITGMTNKGTNYQVENIPSGTRQLLFTYVQTGKTVLAFDDVELQIGGVERRIIDGFKETSVGNVTSCLVEGLPSEETGFYYKVMAVSDGGSHSLWSKDQYVERGGATSVASVADNDGIHTAFAVDDILHCTGLAGERVDVYSADGRICAKSVVDGNGCLTLPLPQKGLYIVRFSTLSLKVLR